MSLGLWESAVSEVSLLFTVVGWLSDVVSFLVFMRLKPQCYHLYINVIRGVHVKVCYNMDEESKLQAIDYDHRVSDI